MPLPIINERFERVWDRFNSIDKALNKADEALNQYKLMSNEFRGTLSDQANRLATKEDIYQVKELIELQRSRMDKAENASANLQGRVWMLAFVFAAAQVIINVGIF